MASGAVPSVSVVIAAWNAEATIVRAIESALAQTGVNVEVIVVDDASSDRTASAAQSVSDPRVIFVARPQNGGPAAARNIGFSLASSAFIAVLDADDIMRPHRLTNLIALAEQQNADIVADNLILHNSKTHDEELFLTAPELAKPTTITLPVYLADNVVFDKHRTLGFLKPVFRARFVTAAGVRYDESLWVGEDFQIVADALVNGAKFVRSNDADYVYTTGQAGSLSSRLSTSKLEAMIEADRRFISLHAGRMTSEDFLAASKRSNSLTQAKAFLSMIELLKNRRFIKAARIAARHPGSLRHFRMPLRAGLRRVKQRVFGNLV